jgi:hypothetical protein
VTMDVHSTGPAKVQMSFKIVDRVGYRGLPNLAHHGIQALKLRNSNRT